MISIHYVGYDVTGKNYERISRPKGSGDYLFRTLAPDSCSARICSCSSSLPCT